MKKSNIIQIIIIIIVIIFGYLLYKSFKSSKTSNLSGSNNSEVSYVKSNLDNKNYLVQNLENKEEATYILSDVYRRIFILRDYLRDHINNYPEFRPYIKQFCDKIKNLTLHENAPNSKYTSYTVNKGEQIALCLRSKENSKLHNINLVMYVAIHELAHVACPEINHTDLFKKIFIFFLKIAVILGIYEKMDYQDSPEEYCGLTINENLFKY